MILVFLGWLVFVVVKNHHKSMFKFNLESVFLSHFFKKSFFFCRFSKGHAKNLPLKNKQLFRIGLVDWPCVESVQPRLVDLNRGPNLFTRLIHLPRGPDSWSLKNKQLFRIGLVDPPRVGGVRPRLGTRLVDPNRGPKSWTRLVHQSYSPDS